MSKRSHTYLLLETRLGESLEEYATAARAAKRSWFAIAVELSQRTGITVTEQTLRNWFPAATSAVAS